MWKSFITLLLMISTRGNVIHVFIIHSNPAVFLPWRKYSFSFIKEKMLILHPRSWHYSAWFKAHNSKDFQRRVCAVAMRILGRLLFPKDWFSCSQQLLLWRKQNNFLNVKWNNFRTCLKSTLRAMRSYVTFYCSYPLRVTQNPQWPRWDMAATCIISFYLAGCLSSSMDLSVHIISFHPYSEILATIPLAIHLLITRILGLLHGTKIELLLLL